MTLEISRICVHITPQMQTKNTFFFHFETKRNIKHLEPNIVHVNDNRNNTNKLCITAFKPSARTTERKGKIRNITYMPDYDTKNL